MPCIVLLGDTFYTCCLLSRIMYAPCLTPSMYSVLLDAEITETLKRNKRFLAVLKEESMLRNDELGMPEDSTTC